MGDLILEGRQYESLIEGAQLTLQILAYSFVLGVLLSLFVGIGRLSHRRWVRGAALVYVELARGISSIVLLFIVAYALPILLDIPQASLVMLASLALGVNMGGYGAELIRGAIQAIPKGQTEATIALNLTTTQRLRHVILPQAMRLILPPMGNLTIEILKGTALVSLVGVTDIMQTASNLWQQQLFAGEGASRPTLYFNALVFYFVIAQVINALFKLAERRVERRFAGGEAEVVEDEELEEIPGVTK
ncbi:amino acid ABC transporter permease [Actinomarinicola tropica]|uniref:ABC transporter permease subunit n=1 Tax=Actinomarinicola tropica TaxID=2789776 RepID=A0A5Q2RKA3_9ACTN|nr:amino acid ABC transporter permease [Actinomarinicola tropica]QGG94487.1 ABC transporter permease subunit [Actinomarinicola tropica]